jgi:hypothetical protein
MSDKQTAIEWLIEQIENQRETGNTDLRTTLHFCDKAKEMEKKQIIDACDAGYDDGCGFIEDIKYKDAEQYYKETFKK